MRGILQDRLFSIPTASRNEMVLIQICVQCCVLLFLRGIVKFRDSIQILRPLSRHFIPYAVKVFLLLEDFQLCDRCGNDQLFVLLLIFVAPGHWEKHS